jgi:hypothetical protein
MGGLGMRAAPMRWMLPSEMTRELTEPMLPVIIRMPPSLETLRLLALTSTGCLLLGSDNEAMMLMPGHGIGEVERLPFRSLRWHIVVS